MIQARHVKEEIDIPSVEILITSSADHPQKTKSNINVHVSIQESTVSTMSNCKGKIAKLVTSKDEILVAYSDVFDGIGCFPGPHTIFKLIQMLHPSKPLPTSPCSFESFKQEIDKMLQVGVLKPVNQATPWINSFVLVEVKISLEISS